MIKKVRNEVKELRESSVSDSLWIHFTPVCIGTVNNPVFSCICKSVSSFVLGYMCSVVCWLTVYSLTSKSSPKKIDHFKPQAVKQPPNCHRLSFLVRPGKWLFLIWIMTSFMLLRKVFLASRTKCIFKLFNNTAYVTERSSSKLSSSVSFCLLCFFSLVISIISLIYVFYMKKDLGNKTSVLSLLNSSCFWFGLHSFLCWKS